MDNLLPLLLSIFVVSVFSQQSAFIDAGYRLPSFREFLVLAPRIVRPDQVYEVHVTINRMYYSNMAVTALLSRDGSQYAYGITEFTETGTKIIQLLIPSNVRSGEHKLVVEGAVRNTLQNSFVTTNDSDVVSYKTYLPIYHNESVVIFDPKYISIFVLTDRPAYVVPSSVLFRIVAVKQDLKPATGTMAIYVQDAAGNYVRRWMQRQLNIGMYEGGFDIEYPVQPGQWAIVIEAFGHSYRHEFEIRFWWQRSFEMNMTSPVYMYDSEWGVVGLIYGEHVSGEPGYGTGNVTVKVMNKDGSTLPGQITKDCGYFYSSKSFSFSLQEIREQIGDPVGKDLLIIGTMYDFYYLETLTGTSVTHVIKDGIKLELLGRQYRTFKPEVPFYIQVAVARSDGTMYKGFYDRQLVVTVSSVGSSGPSIPEDKQIIPDDNILNYQVVPGKDDRIITVSIKHAQSGQTVMVYCYRYYSANNRFLALTSSTVEPFTESYMTFTLKTNFFIEEVNYLIIAGSEIILGSKILMSSNQKTFSVALSRRMSPAARILAYCIVEGEIVMDSMTFFIRDKRLTEPKIWINYGKDFTQDTIEVVAKGPPGGYVSISVADYDFISRGGLPFINEQKVITELLTYEGDSQLPYYYTWNTNDEYWEKTVFFPAADTGMDTNTTALAAGLIIMSDQNITIRQDFSTTCNKSLGLGICPLANQCYEFKRACDGIVDCSDGYDEISCSIPFNETYVPRSNELEYLFWNSRYTDNWGMFWQQHYIKQVGQAEIKIVQDELMDPLIMGGFFMHPTQGFSITKEYVQHDTAHKFFVTVENPDVIRRGEQVGLRLDLFNYWDQDMEVLVILHGDPSYKFIVVEDFGYVVSYSPRTIQGDVQTMVSMKGNAWCTYILMPIVATIAEGTVTVRISSYSSQRIDYNEVVMNVVYDGVQARIRHTPYLVDLVNSGSLVIPDLKINITERFIDPGARDLYYTAYSNRAFVYIYGDMVSPGFFEEFLTSKNTAKVPHDSAEGYIFEFAVNMQTLNYLQTLNLLSAEKQNVVLVYMQTILARQYAYMEPDGAFKNFRRAAYPSIRVTAMCLKYLHQALVSTWAETIFVDINILNRIASWLTQQQKSDGSFAEISPYVGDRNFDPITFDKKTNRSMNLNIALTSYVVISLSLADRLTGEAKQRVDRAKKAGANYIAANLIFISDKFQICIATYALMVAKQQEVDSAYNIMMKMATKNQYMYWANEEIPPNYSAWINNVQYQFERDFHPNVGSAVSATSYALLCVLAKNDATSALPIMKFISSQHNSLMGWSSTQDTILALEAMTQYSYSQTNRAFYNLQIAITSSSNSSWRETVRLDKSNFANLYKFEITPAYGQIETLATGTGYAMMAMDFWVYYEKTYLVENVGPKYDSFMIDLDYQRFWGRNNSHMELNVCFKWLRTDLAPNAGMSNVIVDIPTGYIVSRDTIEWIYAAKFPGLSRVAFYEQQLIAFFEYVSPNRTCFNFVADRWYPVANMSIAHLLVIKEYAESGMQKLSAYSTYTLFQLHICLACGSFQCPYCYYYNGVGKVKAPLNAVSMFLFFFTFSFVAFRLSRGSR